MKKVFLALLCVMSMNVMPVMAQDNAAPAAEPTVVLSQSQWNHGLAVIAQTLASDNGYAQKEDKELNSEFPDGYTLDDLKDKYYGKRDDWMKFYNELKAYENKPEDLDKLKAVMRGFGPNVVGEFSGAMDRYIKEHPASAEPAPAQNAAPANADNANAAQAGEATPSVDEQEPAEEGKSSSGGWGQTLLNILLLVLSLGALALALLARRDTQQLRDSVYNDLEDMRKALEKRNRTDRANDNRPNQNPWKEKKAQPQQQRQPEQKPKREEPKREETKPKREEIKPKQQEVKPKQQEPVREEAKPKQPEPKKEEVKPAVETASPFVKSGVIGEETVIPEKKEEPKREEPKPQPKSSEQPLMFFVSKPDSASFFTEVKEDFDPETSIFRLETEDGVNGKFVTIDNSDVHERALQDPTANLTRACTGADIQLANGKKRIVTDRPGRARFINGKWRVVIKAQIRYE